MKLKNLRYVFCFYWIQLYSAITFVEQSDIKQDHYITNACFYKKKQVTDLFDEPYPQTVYMYYDCSGNPFYGVREHQPEMWEERKPFYPYDHLDLSTQPLVENVIIEETNNSSLVYCFSKNNFLFNPIREMLNVTIQQALDWPDDLQTQTRTCWQIKKRTGTSYNPEQIIASLSNHADVTQLSSVSLYKNQNNTKSYFDTKLQNVQINSMLLATYMMKTLQKK